MLVKRAILLPGPLVDANVVSAHPRGTNPPGDSSTALSPTHLCRPGSRFPDRSNCWPNRARSPSASTQRLVSGTIRELGAGSVALHPARDDPAAWRCRDARPPEVRPHAQSSRACAPGPNAGDPGLRAVRCGPYSTRCTRAMRRAHSAPPFDSVEIALAILGRR